MPPIPQQFFFGTATPTAPPPLKDIASVPYQVRYDTEFREPMPRREERRAAEMEVQTVAPPVAEMEIQTEPEMLRVGGKERALEEVRRMVKSGEKSLALRPARYSPRGGRMSSASESEEGVNVIGAMSMAQRPEMKARLIAELGAGREFVPPPIERGAVPPPSGMAVAESLARSRREAGLPRPTIGDFRQVIGAMREEGGAASGGGK